MTYLDCGRWRRLCVYSSLQGKSRSKICSVDLVFFKYTFHSQIRLITWRISTHRWFLVDIGRLFQGFLFLLFLLFFISIRASHLSDQVGVCFCILDSLQVQAMDHKWEMCKAFLIFYNVNWCIIWMTTSDKHPHIRAAVKPPKKIVFFFFFLKVVLSNQLLDWRPSNPNW